jgi:hypothetical protein
MTPSARCLAQPDRHELVEAEAGNRDARDNRRMTQTVPVSTRNADHNWDAFDPDAYHRNNYATLRGDDTEILRIVRDWFHAAVPAGRLLCGIDVGTGSNLAPAFTLLPHCDELTLWEYATSNIEWLEKTLVDIPESWAPFALMGGHEWWRARVLLPRVAQTHQGSIFDLPERQWQIGTMSFVAESLTEDRAEFERATACFLEALKPNSPFAASFMESSEGYGVGDNWFPAVAVDHADVERLLLALGAVDLKVRHVDIDPVPIRAGYTGYLVATGRVR